MIVFDVNVVLALSARDHPHHLVVRDWFAQRRRERADFGVPTSVWHSFLRIATNIAIAGSPLSLPNAFRFHDHLRQHSGYRDVEPGRRHVELLREICIAGDARANLIPDAVLAAIAIENGATLASFDRDFARFKKLRWIVPGEVD